MPPHSDFNQSNISLLSTSSSFPALSLSLSSPHLHFSSSRYPHFLAPSASHSGHPFSSRKVPSPLSSLHQHSGAGVDCMKQKSKELVIDLCYRLSFSGTSSPLRCLSSLELLKPPECPDNPWCRVQSMLSSGYFLFSLMSDCLGNRELPITCQCSCLHVALASF